MRSIAGYVLDSRGRRVVVVFFVNHANAGNAQPVQDALLQWVYQRSDDACCAQAQHGSAPDIQGQDRANPVSLMLSAAMLFDWLGARHRRPEFGAAAKAIEAAIDAALQKPETRTPDLKGQLGTRAFGQHIAASLAAG